MFRTNIIVAGCLFAATASACAADEAGQDVSFDNVFRTIERVNFAEPPGDPITDITGFAAHPDGGFLIVDGPAHRVLRYSADGELMGVLGREGRGPGELTSPTAVAISPSREVHVVERGSPRLTTFWSDDSVTVSRLPGHYGFWLQALDEGLLVGVGAQSERLARLSTDGDLITRFGRRHEEIASRPFWVFFVREHVSATHDRVYLNSSFSPLVRVFSADGDSLLTIGEAPAAWVPASSPDVATISSDADRARLKAWVQTFSVVAGIAAVDEVVVVQYGSHRPLTNDAYNVEGEYADIFSTEGERLLASVPFTGRLILGGEYLYVLESEPPNGWSISVREWAGA